MTCLACDRAATRPMCGLYTANCPGCEVRAIALAPKHIRQRAYGHKRDEERAAFIAAVAAEHERIKRLRGRVPA